MRRLCSEFDNHYCLVISDTAFSSCWTRLGGRIALSFL
jgi:hypothetical protein